MRVRALVPPCLLFTACFGAAPEQPEPPAVPDPPPAEESNVTPPPARALQRPSDVGMRDDDLGLAVGTPAPDAVLHRHDGTTVRLGELFVDDVAVLLVFYRGGWCPYCNLQVRELAEAMPSFRQRKVRPVLVSVDRIDEAARTQATWEVPFPVLSDPDLAAHEAFHVVHTADQAEVDRLARAGLDVEAASGRTHHRFAVPSMFLVEEGTIRWVHVARDYKTRPSPEQVLTAIDAVREADDDGRR